MELNAKKTQTITVDVNVEDVINQIINQLFPENSNGRDYWCIEDEEVRHYVDESYHGSSDYVVHEQFSDCAIVNLYKSLIKVRDCLKEPSVKKYVSERES